jgi:4-hydroxythreonine-4-phosphate dehydrogenase
MTPPLIAVTMGDPAGIGPEIIARTFDEADFREHNRAIVVGDAGILERAARLLDLPLRANPIAEPEDARFEAGTVGPVMRLSATSSGRRGWRARVASVR